MYFCDKRLHDLVKVDSADPTDPRLLPQAIGGVEGAMRVCMPCVFQAHLLSSGLAAVPGNADGLPFDRNRIAASGNLAADMSCNVAAEATGRTRAVRLSNVTRDPGMKDMGSFLIARDTMRQQRRRAVIEEPGGAEGALPIPNSLPASAENQRFSDRFFATARDGAPPPEGRWTQGRSLDGKGTSSLVQNAPMGEEPALGPARRDSGAETLPMG